ncbi:MAG: Phosphate uptake regulator PhoU [Candidatus Methanohalarchaeum thermophilum]|uniref:Phosphate-specific transport system accessory protein PhoU n=1 Tax=Methanohalarchaeum thermophilum TaxID=1903181 RepID=A0A1Q6DTF6_METT1|nr:MAG: Phosphate uptake regulator PhoU [Candidatus Methanohalarchaeum thermophilum]
MVKGEIKFEERLNKVKKDVLEMSNLSKKSISSTNNLINEFSEEKFNEVLEIEEKSNILNLDVENGCMELTALHQPVARDLRFTASMMKISDNYERICDLAEKIAYLSKERKKINPPKNIEKMQKKLVKMLELLEKSLKEEKTEKLWELSDIDDEIDKLFDSVHNELEKGMKKGESIKPSTDLLFIARYLERAGDITCKIGSRIIYMKKGKRVRIK